MTILTRWYSNKQIVYHQIPKNGCTTIANMFTQADGVSMPPQELTPTGRDREYSYKETHKLSGMQGDIQYQHYDCDISLAIKRDPVARFVSAYTNRIHFHNDLGRDLPGKPVITPSINEFIDQFEEHIHKYWIRIHFLPQSFYGGKVTDHTHVYDISQMHHVAELLSTLSGRPVKELRLQQGGNDIKIKLDDHAVAWIKKYYEEDYENGWF